MLLPERIPTASEQKKWDAVIVKFDKAKRWMIANYLLKINLGILQEFCASNNLQIPQMSSDNAILFTKRAAEFGKIEKAIQAVERLELGISFQNGDINIVAPSWYTKEQIQDYQLGIWPIILAGLAIVLIVGLSAQLIVIDQDFEKCAKDNKKLISEADKALCADPNNPLCKKWKETKKETEFEKTESTFDQIKKGLSEFGKVATKGVGIGLAIAIPLIAWSFFKK